MRLIDADAFEKWAWSNPDIVVDGDGYVLPYAASNFAEEHTIDAVPVVHGRWIPDGNTVCCSECKTLGSPQWKGCPVCLARMDGE